MDTKILQIDVSIVVPCYDRLDLLERTLRACFAQILPANIGFEIIVADNHAEQLSYGLVERLAIEGAQRSRPVRLRYIAAPARNIALARNRGVAAAAGALIGFVDDDEAPEPDWLAQHYATLQRTGADASFGPKYPVFEGGKPPEWDPNGWYYTTDFGMPADAEINLLAWWPIRGRGLGTGNSMLRRSRCLVGPTPFDESYGRTGGEDSRLFFGLARAHRRFVWCPAARVHEFNPRGRLSVDYMRARLTRSARHSAQCRMAISDWPLRTRIFITCIGCAQCGVHAALWIATRRVKHWFGMNQGFGKVVSSIKLDFVAE